MDRSVWPVVGRARRCQQVDAVAPEERHPPVVTAQRPAADPHDLAGRTELVEQARRVSRHASRKHVALEDRCGKGHALELRHGLDQASETAGRRANPVPRGQEAREHVALDRLDLAAEPRQ